jgi:voltage-gated potassium channel
MQKDQKQSGLREKTYEVIFGTNTPAGKAFDLALIYAISISVSAVALSSVSAINAIYGDYLLAVEWFFTIIFTLEYLTRIYCSPKPLHYVRSFYGMVDLLSILPTYLAFLLPGSNYLLMIRIMRVLRIFRVLKLMRYMSEANILMRSIRLSRRKILVFFSFILALTSIFGSLMFIIEGPEHGFTSIPKSIYWAIVTITTVGYGDIAPQTVLGQAIASLAMITGYSVIAVPTGIITAELANEMQRSKARFVCANCNKADHDQDASYCKHCGSQLHL